jgi:hypothetical protein
MIRRISQLLFVAALFVACAGPGLTIYAPPELAEGTILIDGKPAGHFQKTQREYRWLGWRKMKEELTNAPRSETIAKLPPVSPGQHQLQVLKSGYDPILVTFTYSGGREEIEIDDRLVRKIVDKMDAIEQRGNDQQSAVTATDNTRTTN